ncbi:hypothetical protein JCM19992_06070 [Thermostilla marina]
MSETIDVLLAGGGMICRDQILPSLYQLQREGTVGTIVVCARHAGTLRRLANDPELADAFPGMSFEAVPSLDEPDDRFVPDAYAKALQRLRPYQLVVVAVPDHLHFEFIEAALEADQHVLVVKPLVLTYRQAEAVREKAFARGLFVGVEYHKRFDRRALEARRLYRAGRFGEFRLGEARLFEPYYYRHSNFQNWFTTENSDPFTYIGCHYVDQVHFVTGLLPTEVSVRGVEGEFPNGNRGYLWSAARVVWENGALLEVINGLGYPDDGGSWNDQGIRLYCEGNGATGAILHDDRYRGVMHAYAAGDGPRFRMINPDYFRLLPWEGPGLKPVGYGFESVSALVRAAIDCNAAARSGEEPLRARQNVLRRIDEQGLLATPANSAFNELVIEAGRASILDAGRPVRIDYRPTPHIVG